MKSLNHIDLSRPELWCGEDKKQTHQQSRIAWQ